MSTMKTCKRCEMEKSIDDFEKPTTWHCKTCKEETSRIQKKKNVERMRQNYKKKIAENPEEFRRKNNENVLRYYKRKCEENREEFFAINAERCRRYRKKKLEENPEEFRAKYAEYVRRYSKKKREENEEEFKAKNAERKRNNIHTRLNNTKRSAKERGIPIEMTDDELLNMMQLPCTYCNFLDQRGFGGIDRMDNQRGYTTTNTTPCCQRCNSSKLALDPVTFWERCASITYRSTQGELFSYYRDAWPERCSVPKSFGDYKHRAKTKQVPFSLPKATYNEIISKPCLYCHRTGSSGLDRIIPKGAYSPDNVTPACAECNIMRRVLSIEEFYEHCQRVAEHMESSSVLEMMRRLDIPRTTNCLKPRSKQSGVDSGL